MGKCGGRSGEQCLSVGKCGVGGADGMGKCGKVRWGVREGDGRYGIAVRSVLGCWGRCGRVMG